MMNLRDIDLNLLVSLDALLAERSVTAAARRLGRSQPAVSAQLNHLRQLFGDRLLVPQRRGMAPTPRALELAAPLRQLLGGVEAFVAERQRFDPASTTLTLRIAATDAIHAMLGPRLVAGLRAVAPGLRLALLRSDPATVERAFEAATLDLVLLTPDGLAPHWHARRLLHETFVTVLRRGHPASARLDLDRFCALDHLVTSPYGGAFAGAVDVALAALGRTRRVVLSVQDFLTVPRILEQTDLIATMPARVARCYGAGLVLHPPPLAVPGFTIDMAWHPRTNADPAQIWLRAMTVAAAAEI